MNFLITLAETVATTDLNNGGSVSGWDQIKQYLFPALMIIGLLASYNQTPEKAGKRNTENA